MQTNELFEFDVTCLGAYGLTAAWRRAKVGVEQWERWQPTLLISAASTADEGVFAPACDISITSVQGLLALRAAIDEALKYDTPNAKLAGDPQLHRGAPSAAALSNELYTEVEKGEMSGGSFDYAY